MEVLGKKSSNNIQENMWSTYSFCYEVKLDYKLYYLNLSSWFCNVIMI